MTQPEDTSTIQGADRLDGVPPATAEPITGLLLYLVLGSLIGFALPGLMLAPAVWADVQLNIDSVLRMAYLLPVLVILGFLYARFAAKSRHRFTWFSTGVVAGALSCIISPALFDLPMI